MKIEYVWQIKVNHTPNLKRKCHHCPGDRFYCSDKFRVNAQKKSLDVWLVYRCTACDSTYNLKILSRTKPGLIKKELFGKFSDNDPDLAWEYAFSTETARKNRVEQDYSGVEYELVHDRLSIEDLLRMDAQILTFRIQSRFESGMKLSAVIRACLGLSAKRFDQLMELEAIILPEGRSPRKHKVRNGDIIRLDREKLLSLYPHSAAL